VAHGGAQCALDHPPARPVASTVRRKHPIAIEEKKNVSETRAASAARDTSRTVAAGLLAWVWPGLGHLFLGRRGKGLVLMGSILALFGLGVAMDSRLQLHLGLEDPLAVLFSLAQMGVGAPYVLARLLGYEAGLVTSPMYEYGNTFTAVGGLLNILVILDALDAARGVRGK
jgi:TM2 domain-containing membrane protein YozV